MPRKQVLIAGASGLVGYAGDEVFRRGSPLRRYRPVTAGA